MDSNEPLGRLLLLIVELHQRHNGGDLFYLRMLTRSYLTDYSGGAEVTVQNSDLDFELLQNERMIIFRQEGSWQWRLKPTPLGIATAQRLKHEAEAVSTPAAAEPRVAAQRESESASKRGASEADPERPMAGKDLEDSARSRVRKKIGSQAKAESAGEVATGPPTKREAHPNPGELLKGKTRVPPATAAEIFGLSERRIRQLVEQGELASVGTGQRKMILVSSIWKRLRGQESP